MRARNGWIILLGVIWLVILSRACSAIDKTTKGFYYPTGKARFKIEGHGWFGARDIDGYRPMGVWHCGTDIAGRFNDPIFAIADGEVVRISRSGWSDNEQKPDNFGYLICHTLSNGEKFVAVYGHLRRPATITEGSRVSAGQEIGRLGPWSYGIHLHFGIYQNRKNPHSGSYPSTGHGRQPNPRPNREVIAGVNAYGSWFDPIAFIERKSPSGSEVPQVQGKILFCMEENGQTALWTINPDGSGLKKWMNWRKYVKINANRLPSFSPDGKEVIFEDSPNFPASAIYSLNLETKQIRRLFPDREEYRRSCAAPQFSPDGRLIAFKHYWLEDIEKTSATLVNPEIWIMNRDGSKSRSLGKDLQWYGQPRWSKDGRQIVVTSLTTLMIFDLARSNLRRLTEKDPNNSNQIDAKWSPTSDWIAFLSSAVAERSGGKGFWHDLHLIRSNGQSRRILVGNLRFLNKLDWSNDGKEIVLLVYSAYADPRKGGKLIIVDIENPSQQRTIFQTKGEIHWVMWNSFRANF